MSANPEARKFQAFGAALESIQRRYGGLPAAKSTIIQLGLTIVEVCPNDSERLSLVFVNLGGGVVYLAPDPSVSATRGIVIGPSGGSVSMTERDDTLMPTLQWFGLSTLAATDCYLLTVRREVSTGKLDERE